MDLPTFLSLLAVIISIAGFGVSVWATRISKRSHDHGTQVHQGNERREFDRVRSDLLAQISESRAVLDRARIEVGTLEAEFRGEPEPVQRLMASYTHLFSDYLPRIEVGIRQCDDLWRDVSTWDSTKSHAELMAARAVLHRSFQDEKIAHETAVYLVSRFTAKLEVARQIAAAASRAMERY